MTDGDDGLVFQFKDRVITSGQIERQMRQLRLSRALRIAAEYRDQPGPITVKAIKRAARETLIPFDELLAYADTLGYPIRRPRHRARR